MSEIVPPNDYTGHPVRRGEPVSRGESANTRGMPFPRGVPPIFPPFMKMANGQSALPYYQRLVTYQNRAVSVFISNNNQTAVQAWNPEEELPVEEQRLITREEFRSTPAVVLVDPRILEALDQQPEQWLSLDPWKFQEVMAQLLERLGYRPQLGPKGRDGGVDIIADRDTPVGAEVVLVQCKRNAAHKKVGEPVVKQLAMEVDDRRATRGLIVTTSTFTRVALKYIEAKKHKLSGADHKKLQEWVRLVTGR